MPSLPLRAAAAAAGVVLLLSGAPIASGASAAHPWTHVEDRCSDAGVCATFRCNDDGDHCTRITDWRPSTAGDASYYYRDDSRWETQDRRTMERCNGNLCAIYRCDINGDDCIRMTGWRWRS